MSQHDKREEAKREVKRLRENLDAMLKSENINPVAINRIGELQAKANQVYEAANDKYNEAMLEEGHLRTRKSGKAVEMEIQSRIKEFIETGRDDVKKRQEFSLWFSDTGLAISLDLRTGAFEIGIGKVEKNVLVGIDTTLEDIAAFKRDGANFVDDDGNALDMNHFIKQKKIEDSKSKEQKIKESWEMINNPKNVLLQKAIMQHLAQLPEDSSEAKNIRANLKVA